jgi:protein O-GlcNAc transferase
LNLNESLTEAWSGLGYVYSDAGDSAKAIKYFKQAYTLEPFNDDHLYNLAAEYRKVNQRQEALDCLFEIESRQPNDPDLYFFLGDLLAEMDRFDEAICYLRVGLERTGNDPTLLYLLAYLYLERGDKQTALGYLEEALTANPDYYKDFIEFNPELITKDVEVMELIARHCDPEQSEGEATPKGSSNEVR